MDRGTATDSEEVAAEVAPAAVEAAANLTAIKRYAAVERSLQKQASRDQDEIAIAAGRKTRQQLARENNWFYGLKFRVDLAGAKRLA